MFAIECQFYVYENDDCGAISSSHESSEESEFGGKCRVCAHISDPIVEDDDEIPYNAGTSTRALGILLSLIWRIENKWNYLSTFFSLLFG